MPKKNKAKAPAGNGAGENQAQEPKVTPIAMPKRPKITETTLIPIELLVLDAGTQPRLSLDQGTIDDYTALIVDAKKEERPNPFHTDEGAIDVIRTAEGRLLPFNGFHRTFAHKAAKESEINANIHDGTEELAILLSLGANATHGKQRTNKDKQRAVRTALSMPNVAVLSDVQIATICGVSTWLVADNRSVKNSPTTRVTTRKGKQVKVKVKNIGKKGGKTKAKAAKKKAGGAAAGGEESKEKTLIELLIREITKIENSVKEMHGADEAAKWIKGIESGSLDLNKKQVVEFAGLAPKAIGNAWPLVKQGFDPLKAFELGKAELPEKIVTELHNRALASGGEYTHTSGGFVITVTKDKI